MAVSKDGAEPGSDPQLNWKTLAGKEARVFYHPNPYATRRARAYLREAEQGINALQTLLQPDPERLGPPLDLYLIDSIVLPTEQVSASAPPAASEGVPLQPSNSLPLVISIHTDAPETKLAEPLTRLLITRWFDAKALGASAIVEGIAGLAAAQTRTGPTVAEADRWVQEQIEAKRPVSLLPDGAMQPTSPVVKAPAPGETPHESRAGSQAATSFVAFLVAQSGPTALHKFLAAYDPERRDRAANKAFKQPLTLLEEAWRKGMRRRVEGGDAFRKLLPTLLQELKPYRAKWIEIVCYLILAAALSVVPAVLSKWLIDYLKEYASHPSALRAAELVHNFIVLFLVIVVVNIIQPPLSLRRSYTTAWLNQRILNNLQERLYAHLLALSHNFYGNPDFKIGDLMTRLVGDLQNVQQAVSQLTNKGLYQVFCLIAVTIALFGVLYHQLPLVLPLLLLVPLFYASYVGLRTRNKQASREQRKLVGETEAVVQEMLSANDVVKAFGMDKHAMTVYHSRLKRQNKSQLRLTLLNGLGDLSEDTIQGIAQLFIYGMGGYLIIRSPGTMNVGSIMAAIQLVNKLFGPIASLAGIAQTMQQASGAMERVNELFETPVAIADKPEAATLMPLEHAIQIEQVSFSYDGKRPILQEVNLTIPAGANVAFVGGSGCGKSTTSKLLMRFYDPTEGRVLFDGQDLRDVSLASLRKQIGPVLQDTFIFNTTVMDNIRISKPDATDKEVIEAAQKAQLHQDIMEFPGGYNAILGERGGNMSGGQRQRLAIARAFLRDPRILILDEATSALDPKTEAGVLDILAELAKGRTTISIAHRLSWAAQADLVFVLDKGRLVEQGSHATLVKAGGLYQEMWEEYTGYGAERLQMRTSPDRQRLRDIPLFEDLNEDLLDRLAEKLKSDWQPPGVDIVRQGDNGDGLYLIGQGEVEVLLTDSQGERRIQTLGAEDYFGEMALETDAPRSATVRTLVSTQLYRLSREDFRELMQREPDIRRAISGTIASRSAALAALTGNQRDALGAGL